MFTHRRNPGQSAAPSSSAVPLRQRTRRPSQLTALPSAPFRSSPHSILAAKWPVPNALHANLSWRSWSSRSPPMPLRYTEPAGPCLSCVCCQFVFHVRHCCRLLRPRFHSKLQSYYLKVSSITYLCGLLVATLMISLFVFVLGF